jgi:hypothetical protein
MSRRRVSKRQVRFIVISVITIVLSPVILLVGEPLNRYLLRRFRSGVARSRASDPVATGFVRRPRLAWALVRNPLWIALTAPGRWLLSRVGRRRAGRGRGNGPPSAGVREPRRPMPNPPVSAVALPEPDTDA